MGYRAILAICVLAACRFDFDAHVYDAPAGDGVIDAPPLCHPIGNGETMADCLSAFANPSAASDQVVYDCAQSCLFGGCRINDASTCGSCACVAYARSSKICDMAGQCTAPLNGTGCIGLGFYSGAPFNCPSTMGIVFEGACIMRYLVSIGDC